jgi:hypothetical protein
MALAIAQCKEANLGFEKESVLRNSSIMGFNALGLAQGTVNARTIHSLSLG